jgi:hypothetical protein
MKSQMIIVVAVGTEKTMIKRQDYIRVRTGLIKRTGEIATEIMMVTSHSKEMLVLKLDARQKMTIVMKRKDVTVRTWTV